ncbi:alpha/beta fold hydrolase [Cupriavidus consociatus]|uniref:alpha/beta fold hydrolase n=1 Tax=Cupriavidus consociatus TaxID=2821357 RepID=UPI001AE4C1FF|nr:MULTISPECIES: alpha/beta hydrolase [unclassified Cupriavidus]MBP0620716.1 alpha/beta hydrolase [Cupriavidus sp. LEh25]MDK2657376.1 alpha/beta hydrolase [Cupriavidus sp. LEh21]
MPRLLLQRLLAFVFVLGAAMASPIAHAAPSVRMQAQQPDIGWIEIDADISLRRMVVHQPGAKGTVLFLHGFPETLYAWKDIALSLGDDFEVHAIDWPGYGLSSRPTADKFSYAPRDYARVLQAYIRKAGIDTSQLTIYATDIGALPALLLALEVPDIARTIIVGDFAPFDRPQYMYESLQSLKSQPSAELARAQLNKNRDDVLQNAYRRGLPPQAQFDISPELRDDMARGWSHGAMTSADAFYHYYSHFTRDQAWLEANLHRLRTPVKVVWGEKDLYIRKEMGIEFAQKAHAEFTVLPGIGHYPHLQDPGRTVADVRAAFR